MHPALPAEPSPEPSFDPFRDVETPAVGEFRQGTAASQWALARYLVGRAIGESISRSLMVVAVAILAVAGLIEWAGSTFWAVLVAIIALGVLAARALVRAVLTRLTALDTSAPAGARLRAVVADTRADVLRELRRVGLPSHVWTLPLLALRLARGSRRADTLARMRRFDVDNVVPASRVDELHLLLRSATETPRAN